MPNRKQYPDYEEALRLQDIHAAIATGHMLDKIVADGEIDKFINLPADEEEPQAERTAEVEA